MPCDSHHIFTCCLIAIFYKLWIAICIRYVVSPYIFPYQARSEIRHSCVKTLSKSIKLNGEMSLTPQITQNLLEIYLKDEIVYTVHFDFSIVEGSPHFYEISRVATGPFLISAFPYYTLDNMYTINDKQ